MRNISEFVEKVIGAEMILKFMDNNPDERDRYYFVIDEIEEQNDGSYNVISTTGEIINIPTLEEIESAVDGSAYFIDNDPSYKKVFRKMTHISVTE